MHTLSTEIKSNTADNQQDSDDEVVFLFEKKVEGPSPSWFNYDQYNSNNNYAGVYPQQSVPGSVIWSTDYFQQQTADHTDNLSDDLSQAQGDKMLSDASPPSDEDEEDELLANGLEDYEEIRQQWKEAELEYIKA